MLWWWRSGSEQKNREREAVESVSEMVRENEALRSRVTLLERDLALRTKQVHRLAQAHS